MQYLRNVREYFTPVLTQSAFLERGVLTPEEFVKAGDQLIACFPTWKWCSGDPKGIVSYLPKNKQFLIARQVPSYNRATQTNNMEITENTIENEWQDTIVKKNNILQVENLNTIDNNLDTIIDGLDLDEFTVENNQNLIKCRRYDVSITYDKYYQTPKCWLIGYDENNNLLTSNEMFMDVASDYADKTATIEIHPHLYTLHIYIHPCKHSNVMKNMIDVMINNGKTPKVEQYLFLFIKFIQSVVPTIEYDYTTDVEI